MQLTNIFYTALAVFAVSTYAAPTPVAEPHSNTIAPALVTRDAKPVLAGRDRAWGKMGAQNKRDRTWGRMGAQNKRDRTWGRMGAQN